MAINILPLRPEHQAAIDACLDLAMRSTGVECPLSALQIDTLYESVRDRFEGHEDIVNAIAISLGELICSKADFEWVWVEDDTYDSQVSVAPVGYNGVSQPISMIWKRLERGEALDADDLAESAIYTIELSIENGECSPRIGATVLPNA